MERIPKKLSVIVQCGDDIVFEILTLLPAKSLMRFRCVSKAWNALIRLDSNFIKSHIARSQARPLASRILFQLLILPRVPPTTHKLERFSLQLAPRHYSSTKSKIFICSNHCNGLVCFYKKSSRVIYLQNVSTGEIKPLPASVINCYGHTCKLFLGFDTVMKKYKLLHIINYNGRLKVEILTLGTNSVREIESTPKMPFSPYYIYRECIFLNGILYWRSTLGYFDFREEKFGILSPSEDRKIMNPTTLREKLVHRERYGKQHLISHDELSKYFMKYNSDDPNSEKVATLQLEAETTDKTRGLALATASLIGAPASLVFPKHLMLTHVSSFVENIIPLSFIEA